jgi:hypothetical protein
VSLLRDAAVGLCKMRDQTGTGIPSEQLTERDTTLGMTIQKGGVNLWNWRGDGATAVVQDVARWCL